MLIKDKTALGPDVPAPEPRRRLDLGFDQNAQMGDVVHIDTETLMPAGYIPPATSQSPDNPDLMAQFMELNSRVGELQNALGAQRQEYEARLEEQNLQNEMSRMAGMAAPAGLGTQHGLPPGMDPDGQVTAGQLFQILGGLTPAVQAAAIQATWDLTNEEVQTAFAQNPMLQNMPEPARTQYLKKTVELQRKKRGPAQRSPVSPSPQAGSQRQTREVAGQVVPSNENSRPQGGLGEPRPGDAYTAAVAEYNRLAYDKTLSPKERLARQKNAMLRAQAALGITDEQRAETSWKQ